MDTERLSSDEIPGGLDLRTELSLRALRFAGQRGLVYEGTDASVPSIVFGRGEDGRHGNFHPLAFERICGNPQWARRLEKTHTASRRVRARSDWRWRELDCANSSDALLMNIFCHPETVGRAAVRVMLGVERGAAPEFGFKPRTPLHGNRFDNTEIDMKLGDLLVEAKLTEADFQSATSSLITRYRDLETVFDAIELPLRNGRHTGYQLIRGALAAYATGHSFCVLCDARRPALAEEWYRILRTVGLSELRCRLKLLTWQELARALSSDLQQLLAEKYGIFPAS